MCSQTCIKSIQKYCVSLNVSFVFGGHGVSPVLYCSSLLINRGGGLYLEITIFYSCYCSACRFIRETGNCWLFWLLLTWLVYLSLFVCVWVCVHDCNPWQTGCERKRVGSEGLCPLKIPTSKCCLCPCVAGFFKTENAQNHFNGTSLRTLHFLINVLTKEARL